MRIYYVMEAQGHRGHVLSALGVEAWAWNRLHRRVRDWRRRLERRCGIPADACLYPSDLLTSAASSCGCGCHAQSTSKHGAEVVAQGLRVAEDFAVETGGVQMSAWTWTKRRLLRVALDRLFTASTPPPPVREATPCSSSGRNPMRWSRTYERLRSVPFPPSAWRTWSLEPAAPPRPRLDAAGWNDADRPIPTADACLYPSDLLTSAASSCGCGCHAQSTSKHGAEVVAQGLRVADRRWCVPTILCRRDRR